MTTTITEAETQAKAIKWEDYYREPYADRDADEVLSWQEHCGRCGGQGYIRAFAFNANGVCFDCMGHNSTWTVVTTVGKEREKAVKTARKEAAAARKAIRETAKKDAAEAALHAQWVGKYPVMHHFTREGIDSLKLTDWATNVLDDMLFKNRKWGLSEKQVEFAARLLDEALVKEMTAPIEEARKAEKEAAKVPAPKGRMFVTGTVVKAKDVEKCYGYQTTYVRRLCIETEEGWTLFVNCPDALAALGCEAEEAEVEAGTREEFRRIEELDSWTKNYFLVGRKVKMNVTVEPAEWDASQGMGSRPTKPEIV